MATDPILEGRVAVVTGAARGIGRGIAVELARAGAQVAIGDLVHVPEIAKDAEETAALVEAQGRSARVVACDVADPSGPEALMTAAAAEWGGIDYVVSNAGVLGAANVVDLDPAEWERLLRVNATGTFHTCRAALPHLMARGGGAIVNISSVTGLRGAAGRAHYSASKFAVIGLSESLALEVAESKIRVNCIAPSSVRSHMTLSELMRVTKIDDPARADEVWTKVSKKRLPFGRSVEPEDIGRAVVFLCGAEMISGIVLPVTGGDDLRRSD